MVKMLGILAGITLGCLYFQSVSCMKRGVGALAPTMSPDSTGTAANPDSVANNGAYLALGDSYTIGQSVSESDRYPVQVVGLLRQAGVVINDPLIIARTGWTTTALASSIPARLTDSPYQVVSLLIGVNDQYQGRSQSDYQIDFTHLLTRAVQLAGGRASHVIVLSIPDYSVTPFARGSNRAYIAAQIDSFNLINRQIASSQGVHYIDITGDSRLAASDPSLIAGDSLHFSGKEYAVWAAKMAPVIRGMR